VPDGVHCITICDREGDFYELYAEASELETDFVIRVTHDRLSDTDEKIVSKIRHKKAAGTVKVNIPRDSRSGKPACEAEMEVAYCQVNVKKPTTVNNENLPEKLSINLVRITELNPPDGCDAIEWILATSLPINTIYRGNDNCRLLHTTLENRTLPFCSKKRCRCGENTAAYF